MPLLFVAHFITKSLSMTVTADTTVAGAINDSESSNYLRENLCFNVVRLAVTFPKMVIKGHSQFSLQ